MRSAAESLERVVDWAERRSRRRMWRFVRVSFTMSASFEW